MIFSIKQDFANSAQRLVYNFAAMRADYKSTASKTATNEAQRQFFDFMTGVYTKLYDDPTIVGMIIDHDETEDTPHPHRVYKEGTHRYLESRKLLRKNQKILADFFASLEWLGVYSKIVADKLVITVEDLKCHKPTKSKLSKLLDTFRSVGFDVVEQADTVSISCIAYPKMCDAWKLLSQVSDSNKGYDAFVRHVYDVEADNIFDVMYRHVDKKSRNVVKNFFEFIDGRGFVVTQQKCVASTGEGDNLRIRLSKKYIDIEITKNADVNLTIEVGYEYRRYRPLSFRLLTGKEPFYVLHHRFSQLSPGLQDFVVKISGQCRACGFCVQMNRDAALKREKPYNYNTVNYLGKETNLCYYFKHVDLYGNWNEYGVLEFEFTGQFLQDIIELYDWFEATLVKG